MSDYSEHGAVPVEDGAVHPEELPTDAEVRSAQEEEHPEQAATAFHGDPRHNTPHDDADRDDPERS